MKFQELRIAKAMLLGAEFHYDDYGHPERATSRNYHQCIGPNRSGNDVTGYGKTQHEAAFDWMRRCGYLDLLT